MLLVLTVYWLFGLKESSNKFDIPWSHWSKEEAKWALVLCAARLWFSSTVRPHLLQMKFTCIDIHRRLFHKQYVVQWIKWFKRPSHGENERLIHVILKRPIVPSVVLFHSIRALLPLSAFLAYTRIPDWNTVRPLSSFHSTSAFILLKHPVTNYSINPQSVILFSPPSLFLPITQSVGSPWSIAN